MNEFETNKLILSLIEKSFIDESIALDKVVDSFAKDISHSRTSLCEAFRIFGNSKYTWFGGAEEDIKALCDAVLTGYQSASARHFKNSVLAKTRFFVAKNDKKSFFRLCQSIVRSAQQNAPFIYNLDEDSNCLYEENYYELEEDMDNFMSPNFKNLSNFYVEVTARSDEIKIKSGNVYKKKFKKSIKRVQPSLFEVEVLA